MRNKILKDLCIILVSFKSKKKVEKTIKNLNKKISIILIENSKDFSVKKELEKKYKNLQVVIPKSNNGQGAAFNIAAKKTSKKYLLFMDIDIKIKKNQILELLKLAKKLKVFGVLTPKINNHNYKKSTIKKINRNLLEVSFNHGCVMLVKKNLFKKVNYFDDNIFLYFEESDLFAKFIKKKLPIYMYNKVKISNPISKSIDKEYQDKYIVVRNWHYCWSKFYYYKKHHGYFVGFLKTIPNLFRAIKNLIFCVFRLEFSKTKYFYAELSGLFFSYLNFRSFYRIKD